MSTNQESVTTHHKPRLIHHKSTPNGGKGEPRDELMRKFSKNMRKVMTHHQANVATSCESDAAILTPKSVTFNSETIETSFGGTQTPGKIAELSLVETVKGDCKPTDRMFTKSTINPSIKKSLLPMENGSTTQVKKVNHNSISKKHVLTKGAEHRSETAELFGSEKENSQECSTPTIAISSGGESMNGCIDSTTPMKPPRSAIVNKTGSSNGTPQLNRKAATGTNLGSQTKLAVAGSTKLDHAALHKTPSPFMMKHQRFVTDADFKGTPEYYNPVAFETPVTDKKHRWSSGENMAHQGIEEDSVSMTVAVRVRPFTQREEEEERCIVTMVDNETVVHTERGDAQRFTFDYSFWSYDQHGGEFASQQEVYTRLARPMLSKAFEGYNTCLFAYGQTGSGKSYSIMGTDTSEQQVGIIPRFCDELFEQVEGVTVLDKNTTLNVEISYFEIYNEKIHDLLCPSTKVKSGKKPNLKVREHPVLGPYVEGLSSYVVNTFDDVKSWLSVGNKHRATAATGMNDKSSRSHSVFTTLLTQTKSDTIEGEVHEHSVTSKINIVDLAGSERQTLAKTSGDRLREGASINKSLHTLAKVISVLAEQGSKKKKMFVPYRDSVLTWLLKESVGGNSKTAMLATISPSARHVEETLSTLRYARQARSIINKVRVNEDPKARLIRELKAEIERMRLAMGGEGLDTMASLAEVSSLREQLAQREQQMREMSKSWQERLQKSEEKKQEEARLLERSGVAFKVDSSLPNLVNLNEDPQLSEVLLYVLREGVTRVGRQNDDSEAEIQLVGPLIADEHCVIENQDKVVRITPQGDAPTYVNGDLITESTHLHHGDRVILGGDHYFRLNYPAEAPDKRSSGTIPSQPRDFEYARQELTRVQNEKLEQELDEARRKHEAQLAEELSRQQSRAQDELHQLKQEANEQLCQQRHEYEDRLKELEALLKEQHDRMQLSDEHQATAKDSIRKLEQEKLVLEQEVLLNRKRMECEVKASHQAVAESKQTHSQLVKQIQAEKEKLDSEKQRYELKKRQRATQRAREIARAQVRGSAKQVSGPKQNLYRIFMLIREANKISQLLNKDTVFTQEEKVIGEGDPQTVVKVTNKKLRISTYWTVEKLEQRLVRMKELYEGEEEPGSLDDTFYDPGDAWEKEDRLAQSPGLSPQIVTSLRRQVDPSVRSPLSTQNNSPRSPIYALTDSGHLSKGAEAKNITQSQMTQQLLGFYRDVISSGSNAFNDTAFRESFADKILLQSEIIKSAVTTMLQAYNRANEQKNLESSNSFYEHPDLLTCMCQVQNALSNLQNCSALWRMQSLGLKSSLVDDLFESIITCIKTLSSHLVLFLQGCENDIDSMVQEASCHVFSTAFSLCQSAGELALATDLSVTSLHRQADASEEDLVFGKVGVDVRQHFLKGCDKFIDRTLQGGAKSVEECEFNTLTYSEESENMKESSFAIVKQVEMTVASCKILFEHLQTVQVELDSTLSVRDSLQAPPPSTQPRPSDYYAKCYTQCRALIGQISDMADGVALLTQATQNFVKSSDSTGFRRLQRCAEMIQKATTRILATSCRDAGALSDSQSDFSSTIDSALGRLTDIQCDKIAAVGQEVEFATNTLVVLLKREMELEQKMSPSKGKRVLPLSPRSGSSQLPRRQRAQNVRRNLAEFDC